MYFFSAATANPAAEKNTEEIMQSESLKVRLTFMADIFILPIAQQPKRERLRLSIWSQHGQLSTNVL